MKKALEAKETAEAKVTQLRVSLAQLDEQIAAGDTVDYDKLLVDVVSNEPDSSKNDAELRKVLKKKQAWQDTRAMLDAKRSVQEAALQQCTVDVIAANEAIASERHADILKEMRDCAKSALLDWHNLAGLIEQYAELKQRALAEIPRGPAETLYSPQCAELQKVAGEMVMKGRTLGSAATGSIVSGYRGMGDVLEEIGNDNK
ncbi:hypothetical protein Nstercoris_00159 [Nitrosomonas stercoris]|uniref:Uncharacterized protein n=1 Tax=Nitrosomonas stercoris TaxID=1444684 RepID=A0A4Y1YIM1_9PROT|nr:hypothetical protein Nstercoris_00159 [Nitrosomonas stercoris]